MLKTSIVVLILVSILCVVQCSYSGTSGWTRRQCRPGRTAIHRRKCGLVCDCSPEGVLVKCTRQRKEFTTMSRRERKRYIKTVKKAFGDPRYKSLITLHQNMFFSDIHKKKFFLPWHRWFLLQFENLLRDIDCRVTLPYWDWSIASGDPWGTAPDDLWYNGGSGFGGNGEPSNNYCVNNGPFALDQSGNQQHCKRRQFRGYPPDSVAVAELLDIAPVNFTDFEMVLRLIVHDTMHCLIGGTMCSLSSASAPEFFLHHGFIDKIWTDWQSKSEEHKTVYFQSLNDPMPGTYDLLRNVSTTTLPRDVLDNNALPGNVRVDYLDVNDTQTAFFIKRLRRLSVRKLKEIPREDFTAFDDDAMKLFKVELKEVLKAKREEKKIRPRYRKERKFKTRRAKRLGFDEEDVDRVEKEKY